MTLALLWRAAPYIAGALAVIVIIGSVWAWAHGKDVQIHRAQSQRNAAVLAFVRDQSDLVIARVNNATLTSAISRQNEAVTALHEQGVRASREASEGLRRAAERHRTDEARIAVLRRPLVAATPCARADEAAARAREALR